MGLVDKPAFTAGELDPALWERTNLDKYRTGLAVARNWMVSKGGSILTRQGRQYFGQTKLASRTVRLYSPPGGGVMMEWGHQYVRIYSLTTWSLLFDVSHSFVEADLPNLHFDNSGSYVYVFCAGKSVLKMNYATGAKLINAGTGILPATPDTSGYVYAIPSPPISGSVTGAGTPAGYSCSYVITYVYLGQESWSLVAGTGNLPIAAGQTESIVGTLCALATTTNTNPGISEMKVYRRPATGGAYGFIGSSTTFGSSGGNLTATFLDYGQDADYSHQPPSSIMAPDPASSTNAPLDPSVLLSNTGIVYQQRLLITDYVTDLQAIYASQPGFQNNYYRNYPLDAASALKFKCGTSGYAKVLRMLDSDGLVAFTAAGIFLNQGELNPDNISMTKKGKWIINPVVPPLAIPGGVMFVDSMTNGVRNLLWSFQLNAFDADEISIYSNHLFRTRAFQTWNFQLGAFPLLWVVFTDGTAAAFTYDYNQQMQAWTRHDSKLEIESCCGTSNADQTFFVVKKTDSLSGAVTRYIEVTVPRYAPATTIASDQDYDKDVSCAYMDGIITSSMVQNDYLTGSDGFVFSPTEYMPDGVTPDWSGVLNLSCGTSAVFSKNGLAAASEVGINYPDWIFRFFDEDGSVIDLSLIAFLDANNVQVQVKNVDEFPASWANNLVKLYLTFTYLTGLSMFEGESPAVIVDGAVVASPNNDDQNYADLIVSGGRLDLPTGVRAAIMHVGRPIVGDVETLDIDTVEQSPTLIESLTVNKVYVKVKDAKSLYIGPKFPPTDDPDISADGVSDMVSIDNLNVDYERTSPIIGNRAQPSQTRRYEVVLSGDYSQQGKICVRQVDPLHAEILSFIPDVQVQKRSDR